WTRYQRNPKMYDLERHINDTTFRRTLWTDVVEIFKLSVSLPELPEPAITVYNFYQLIKCIQQAWDMLHLTSQDCRQVYNIIRPFIHEIPIFKEIEDVLFPARHPDHLWKIIEETKNISELDPSKITIHSILLVLVEIRNLFRQGDQITPFQHHLVYISCSSVLLKNIINLPQIALYIDASERFFSNRTRFTEVGPHFTHVAELFRQALISSDKNSLIGSQIEQDLITTFNTIDQKMNSVYKDHHDQYYEEIASLRNGMKEIQLQLAEMKKGTQTWTYSPSFDMQVANLHEMIKVFQEVLPKGSGQHQITFGACTCGYKLKDEVPSTIWRGYNEYTWNKLRTTFSSIKDHYQTWSQTNGEIFTEQMLAILSALYEVEGRVGRSILRLILKGSKNQKIFAHGLETNKQYGSLEKFTLPKIMDFIDDALMNKFLQVKRRGIHNLPFLYLAPKGHNVLTTVRPQISDAFVEEGDADQILRIYRQSPASVKEHLLSLIVDKERQDVILSFVTQFSGEDIDAFIAAISPERHRYLEPLLFRVLLNNWIAVAKRKTLHALLKEMNSTFLEKGLAPIIMQINPTQILQLYKSSLSSDQDQIIHLVLKHNRLDLVDNLLTEISDTDFNHLLDNLKRRMHSPKISEGKTIAALLFTKIQDGLSRPKLKKIREVLSQVDRKTIIQYIKRAIPITDPRKMSQVYQESPPVFQDIILELILEKKSINILNVLLQETRGKSLETVLNGLCNLPPKQRGQVLLSFLLTGMGTETKRQQIRRTLTLISKNALSKRFQEVVPQITVDQILNLFNCTTITQKALIIETILTNNRLDLIETLITQLKGTEFDFFFKCITKTPSKKIGPILFSILLEEEAPLDLRQQALSCLIQIDKENPMSGIKQLLAGLLPFEKGTLKKEIRAFVTHYDIF
ncbi:MAG: RQC domain-containing protein, partial [Candidatus Hodarchaeota archaeon]